MAKQDWNQLLGAAKARSFSGRLVRCIPQLTFQKGLPPSYLFTSGAVNRCNPAGVRALYMSEDRHTAHAEYASYYPDPEPELTFYADFQTNALLDFQEASVRRHFDVSDDDFFKAFWPAAGFTPLQLLGAAIAAQTVVTAIRYPSNARRRKGEHGFNFAVFRDSIRAPDSLTIPGAAGAVLERWP